MSLRALVFLAVSASALGALAPVRAQPAQTVGVEILASGAYRAEIARVVPDPSSALGTRNIYKGVTFTSQGPRVAATLGSGFGFRFRLSGVDDAASVQLVKITHFPPPGLTNPKTGRMQASNTTNLALRGPRPRVTGYTFDEPWEIATGEWRIELWHEGRKLAEQRYTVAR